MNSKKILIGGAALKQLGNDRFTDDVDDLIYDESSEGLFRHEADADYINAAHNEFYAEAWMAYQRQEIGYEALLAETKAYAFVQHCKNMNFKKADAAEYDLKFLHREFNIAPAIVRKYVDRGAWSEIMKIYA